MKNTVGLGKGVSNGRFMTAISLSTVLLIVLFVILLATSYSSTAEAQEGPSGADQITFKAPRAVPVDVAFTQEIKATAESQQPLTLTVAGQDYEVKPGDFSSSKTGTTEAQSVVDYTASVSDIKVPAGSALNSAS